MIPYYEKYLSVPEITDNGIYIKVKCIRFSPNCPLSAWAKRHKSLRTAAIGVPTVFRLQPLIAKDLSLLMESIIAIVSSLKS